MSSSLVILPEHDGKRLDAALASQLDISRSAVQTRILEATLSVNQKIRAWSHKVKATDTICFDYVVKEPSLLKPEKIALDIVYEDNEILIVNKPAGLVVHAGGGAHSNTLVNGLLFHFLDSKKFKNTERPGIVHRLDKDTSGVMVVAKNEKSLIALQKQFSERTVEKEYRAIVIGNIKGDEITIEASIGRNPKDRKKMGIDGVGAREAVTVIRVLSHCGELCYVAAFPKTGRTHQIRVHLSSVKHPIFGDAVYGSRRLDLVKGMKVARQMLHAYRLKLKHPKTGLVMEWSVKIPPDMQRFLNVLVDPCRKRPFFSSL